MPTFKSADLTLTITHIFIPLKTTTYSDIHTHAHVQAKQTKDFICKMRTDVINNPVIRPSIKTEFKINKNKVKRFVLPCTENEQW